VMLASLGVQEMNDPFDDIRAPSGFDPDTDPVWLIPKLGTFFYYYSLERRRSVTDMGHNFWVMTNNV
jgi:hypothetical protein